MPPAYEDLADQLAGQIRAGVYQPGERLPSRRKLAREGSSDQVAQDAMAELVRRGLVESRPGAGYYVLPDPGPDYLARLKEVEAEVARLRAEVDDLKRGQR